MRGLKRNGKLCYSNIWVCEAFTCWHMVDVYARLWGQCVLWVRVKFRIWHPFEVENLTAKMNLGPGDHITLRSQKIRKALQHDYLLFYVSERTENSFNSSVCIFSLVKRNFHNFSAFILEQLSLHLCLQPSEKKEKKSKSWSNASILYNFLPKPRKQCTTNYGDERFKDLLRQHKKKWRRLSTKKARKQKLRQQNYNQLIVTDLNKFIINI